VRRRGGTIRGGGEGGKEGGEKGRGVDVYILDQCIAWAKVDPLPQDPAQPLHQPYSNHAWHKVNGKPALCTGQGPRPAYEARSGLQSQSRTCTILHVLVSCWAVLQSLHPLMPLLQPFSDKRMRGVIAAALLIAFGVFGSLAVGSSLAFGPALEVGGCCHMHNLVQCWHKTGSPQTRNLVVPFDA
jgi:hypothetical protein